MFDHNRERCHSVESDKTDKTRLIYDNCLELGLDGKSCNSCNHLYYGLIDTELDNSGKKRYGCMPYLKSTHHCDQIYRTKSEIEEIPEMKILAKPQCKTCKPLFEYSTNENKRTYCHLENCKVSSMETGKCSQCKTGFRLAMNKDQSKHMKDETEKRCAKLTEEKDDQEGGKWL